MLEIWRHFERRENGAGFSSGERENATLFSQKQSGIQPKKKVVDDYGFLFAALRFSAKFPLPQY
ncbi:MAG: hypothetical protein LBU66_00460 [Treponema sp.]|jgi:hypothetical protein|nr:hypothetical protein [Treponema sp.]